MDAATPKRLVPLALALGLLALTAGCSPNQQLATAENHPLDLPQGTISVYQLAGRLGLKVDNCSSSLATLCDERNCVRVYAGERTQPSVNGRPVGPVRAALPVGGMLFVSAEWESSVRALVRAPRPPEPPRPPAEVGGACVIVDAGHGGHDSGAVGVGNVHEKTVNLGIATAVAQTLSGRGVAARMTRSDDRFIELNDRADFANTAGAKLFVSVHANSHPPNPGVRGYDVYIARAASGGSERAAAAISKRIRSAGVPAHGNQPKRENFRVLVRTSCPAVLVETGFLSNPAEAGQLTSAAYQRRIAAAIAQGILDYLQTQ